MHLRFDGRLGFPGGIIDKVTEFSLVLYCDRDHIDFSG